MWCVCVLCVFLWCLLQLLVIVCVVCVCVYGCVVCFWAVCEVVRVRVSEIAFVKYVVCGLVV